MNKSPCVSVFFFFFFCRCKTQEYIYELGLTSCLFWGLFGGMGYMFVGCVWFL
jgi:hypothetical protein